MLHGKIAWIFGLEDSGIGSVNYKLKSVDDFCDHIYSHTNLRSDLIQTLCEEFFYPYGIAKSPEIGFQGQDYKHSYHGSTFLDLIQRLIRELGEDEIFDELCDKYKSNPDNKYLDHNLQILFSDIVIQKNQKDGVNSVEIRLKSHEGKPTIDKSLPFEERWEKLLHNRDFEFIYRYFHLENDEEQLKQKLLLTDEKTLILNSIPSGNKRPSWKKFKASFAE